MYKLPSIWNRGS